MATPELEHRNRQRTSTGAGSAAPEPTPDLPAPVAEQPLALGGLASVHRSAAGAVDELGGTPAAPDVVSALRRRQGQGAPLPEEVAGPLGQHMGADLGGVRIHADKEADTIARSVQATAFTHGSDIYFSQGTYQPTSEPGQKLLAHELAHVAQHRSGADPGSGGGGAMIGRADDPVEKAADQVADSALGALRRRADTATATAEVPAGARHAAAPPINRKLAAKPAAGPAPEIRRWFGSKWFSKKKKPSAELADAKAEAAAVAAVTPAAVPGRSRSDAVSGGPAPMAVPAKPVAAASTPAPVAATAPVAEATPVAPPAPDAAAPATKPAKPPRAPKVAKPAVVPEAAAAPEPAAAPEAAVVPAATVAPEAAVTAVAPPAPLAVTPATKPASKPAEAAPDAATTPAVATPEAQPAPVTVAPVTAGPVPDKVKEASPAPVAAPVTASPGDAAPGKPPKEAFTEAVKGGAPAGKEEAKTRMTELRAMLKDMSASERESISTDKALMAKAREFVGTFEYMSLVTAVGMSAKTPPKPGAAPKPQHLSGSQADTFIQSEMGKIGHLKPYLDTAIGAGKKADGFVAVVSDEDWKVIYQQQNGKDADTFGQNTNAFIANTHSDRPAIIHEDRGTPSTAIHESMHRYSVLNTLHAYGSPLNEGMTEYFTRMITDKDGKPLNGKPSNRDNYQANYDFMSSTLIPLLGAGAVEAQTTLAEIYFSGKTEEIETKFREKCTAAKLDKVAADALWAEFSKALKAGDWAKAKTSLPPAPAT